MHNICSNGQYQQAGQDLINNPNDGEAILNRLDWGDNTELARSLQDSVLHSQVSGYCNRENVRKKIAMDVLAIMLFIIGRSEI